MRASNKRALFLAGLALLVAGGLVYAFWPQSVPVDTTVVDRGEVRVTVDGEGKTRVRDVFVVSAPLSGRISRIDLRPGDHVEARRTVLTTLEETEPAFIDARARAQAQAEVQAAQARHELARAEVDRVEAELTYSRSELGRVETLYRREAVPERALDQARMQVRTDEARLATAEAAVRMRLAELRTARAMLIEPGMQDGHPATSGACCIPIRPPVSGKVLRVLQESETVVSPGMPLIEIGDPANLEIVVDLPSEQAVRIDEGDPVIVEGWGGADALEGRVRRVEPFAFTKVSALGIEEQRVNVVMDLLAAPEVRRALGHGYRVMTRTVVIDLEDVPRVPAGAMFRDGGNWAVFVVEDGRARLRAIEIGANDGRYAEIREGLETGERILLYPSDRVLEGVRVVERAR